MTGGIEWGGLLLRFVRIGVDDFVVTLMWERPQ